MSRETVADKLTQHNCTLIFTNRVVNDDNIQTDFIGTESLFVNIDKFTYLANKNSLKFQELHGLSFLVLTDIGIWKQIIQTEIPDAKFLYQDQVDAFTEITKYSNFPYFSTNLSKIDPAHSNSDTDDRVKIALSDSAAQMPFYAAYLKENKHQVTPLIQMMKNAWI